MTRMSARSRQPSSLALQALANQFGAFDRVVSKPKQANQRANVKVLSRKMAPRKNQETSPQVASKKKPNSRPSKNNAASEKKATSRPTKKQAASEKQVTSRPSKKKAASEKKASARPSKKKAASEKKATSRPSKKKASEKKVTARPSKKKAASKKKATSPASKKNAASEKKATSSPSKKKAATEKKATARPSKRKAATEKKTTSPPSKRQAAREKKATSSPSKKKAIMSRSNKKKLASEKKATPHPRKKEVANFPVVARSLAVKSPEVTRAKKTTPLRSSPRNKPKPKALNQTQVRSNQTKRLSRTAMPVSRKSPNKKKASSAPAAKKPKISMDGTAKKTSTRKGAPLKPSSSPTQSLSIAGIEAELAAINNPPKSSKAQVVGPVEPVGSEGEQVSTRQVRSRRKSAKSSAVQKTILEKYSPHHFAKSKGKAKLQTRNLMSKFEAVAEHDGKPAKRRKVQAPTGQDVSGDFMMKCVVGVKTVQNASYPSYHKALAAAERAFKAQVGRSYADAEEASFEDTSLDVGRRQIASGELTIWYKDPTEHVDVLVVVK